MLGLDDYASLALFARVVHLRSFSAAAKEAAIAKSAVSRRVARLEATLGVRLLQRTTRKLSVTDEGLRVYEQCAALVAAASAAEEAAGAAPFAVRGTLRVNAPVTFAQLHLASMVAAFLKAYPEVEVRLSTEDRIVDVVEGAFDVAIRIGRLSDSSLVARRIARDRLVVCASPAYLVERGEPRRPEELEGHNCLHYGLVERDAEWQFRRGGRRLAIAVSGNLTATNGTVLREAAVAGLGLAVLPSFMVTAELRSGALRLLLEGARRAEIGIYAITAHRTFLPARTKAFVEFAAKHFAQNSIAHFG